MKVSGFALKNAEIGAESIQPVLQLNDAESGFCLFVLKSLKLVERIGKLLFLCRDAFSQTGFNIACLFDNLLHLGDFLAKCSILLVGLAQLFRIINLRVAAAQR